MNPAANPIEKKQRIESLYLLKAICSFFVVMIHSACWFKDDIYFILGVGTPCFLSITGYLLYSNNCSKELNKCINWAKKLFKLSFICSLIYPLVYCPLIDMDWTWKTFLINLLTGRRFCFALWYLTALWQALLIFWVIRKYIPQLISWLPVMLILTYIIRQYFDEVNLEILEYLHISHRNNAIVTALPFLSVGYLIHQHKEKLLKAINVNIWLPVVLVALFLEYKIRVHFSFTYSYFFILSFPCIFLLILFCIRHSNLQLPILNTIGKKHSANIYYFHMIFIAGIRYLNIESSFESILVWVCCIPLSIIFNYTTEGFSLLMTKGFRLKQP